MSDSTDAGKFKNRPFFSRLKFAFAGMRSAFSTEKSIRFHFCAFVGVSVFSLLFQVPAIWYAIFLVCSAGVISLELVNTGIETYLDHFYPEENEVVGKIKDVLAAAVLVFSAVSLIIFFLYLNTRL